MRLNNITRSFGRISLSAKKQSPHIFFGLGVAGVVTGGVLACKATLNLDETLNEIRKDQQLVKDKKEHDLYDGKIDAEFIDAENRRLVVAVHIKGGLKIVKLYGPAILLTSAGIAALAGSHVQMTRRNAALQAGLIAVQQAYDDYRDRVREEIGEERELEIFRNLDELAKADAPKDWDPNRHSVYARVFNETNGQWKHDAELNRMFISLQQNHANHLLNSRGHVFLNDVYDLLGFERSRIGSIVGWYLDGNGDNFIDFGIDSDNNILSNALYINGLEFDVFLDFNVDGVIFDRI